MRLFGKSIGGPKHLAAAAAVAMLAAPVAQAEGISSKFDGNYAGTGTLVAPLSGPGCDSDGMRYRIEIRNGRIDGEAFDISADDQVPNSVKGFVTADGYFTGSQERDKGPRTRFEGRMDDSMMVAGVFTQGYNCAWVVKLKERA